MRFTEVVALNILDRMVQRMEEGQRIEIFDIRTVIKFLRVFADRYPQAEVVELVESIEASLNPKHGAGFVRSSRRLLHLLQNQINPEQIEAIASEFPEMARLERKYAPKSHSVPIERDRRAHA
jgi:hypothetical protein